MKIDARIDSKPPKFDAVVTTPCYGWVDLGLQEIARKRGLRKGKAEVMRQALEHFVLRVLGKSWVRNSKNLGEKNASKPRGPDGRGPH